MQQIIEYQSFTKAKTMKNKGIVLISEKNKGYLSALSILVQKEFEEVITESDKERIMQILQDKEVDIIVLDTGINTVSQQKEHLDFIREISSAGKEIQIIVLTNFSQNSFGMEAVNAGAFDFVPKPWNNEKFIVTLKNAFRMRKLSMELNKKDTMERELQTLEQMERKMMEMALEKCNGNVTLAAGLLGITRQTLYNKGKKYNLFK